MLTSETDMQFYIYEKSEILLYLVSMVTTKLNKELTINGGSE